MSMNYIKCISLIMPTPVFHDNNQSMWLDDINNIIVFEQHNEILINYEVHITFPDTIQYAKFIKTKDNNLFLRPNDFSFKLINCHIHMYLFKLDDVVQYPFMKYIYDDLL